MLLQELEKNLKESEVNIKKEIIIIIENRTKVNKDKR